MLKKGFIDFAYIALPKVLAGSLTLLFNIVLLRYLSIEEFGVYTLCVSAILLTDAIIGSAIDMGVLRLSPLYRSTNHIRSINIEKAALSFKLFLSLLVFSIVIFYANAINLFLFDSVKYMDAFFITFVAAIFVLMFRSVLVHLQVDEKFLMYGKLDFIHIAIKYGGIASLILLSKVTPENILLFFVFGPGVAFVIGLALNHKQLLGSFAGQLSVFGELFGYIKWYLITFMIAAAISRMDIFLLTGLRNLTDVGIFAGGYVYAMIPELFGIYLAIIISPKIMPLYVAGDFFLFYKKIQSILWLTAISGYLVLLFALQFIAPLLLPPSFMASMDVMLGLFMGTLASMAIFPATVSFIMFVKPRFILWLDLITFPILLLLYMKYIPEYGAVGAAWVGGISRLVKAVIVQIVVLPYTRVTTPITEEGMKWDSAFDTDVATPRELP